jgi:DNA recombination protein RmuC
MSVSALLIMIGVLNILILLYLVIQHAKSGASDAGVARELALFREEVERRLKDFLDTMIRGFGQMSSDQQARLDAVAKAGRELEATQKQELDRIKGELAAHFKSSAEGQLRVFSAMQARLDQLLNSNREETGKLRDRLEAQFRDIQASNEKKLEEMRLTVDEKLHSTLEKRLGESFQLVSTQLEAVQKGLGEMTSLASGVGDLKRVLTNVKTRGTWGEMQLEAILEQLLTRDQYEKNVKVKSGSAESVEFAVKLPGRDGDKSAVWLPIDSKFPKESYERLIEASQAGDADGVRTSQAALVRDIVKSAGDISKKYVEPPATTNFAIMFLPTEGLYAEVLREPGLHDRLQQEFRVLPAGPTTLSAMLNSLRVGFNTLAIEKRSGEVWQILSAVKTEFGKFGEVLEKVQQQLSSASETIDKTKVRTRAIERKLKGVESMPGDEAATLLNMKDRADWPADGEE